HHASHGAPHPRERARDRDRGRDVRRRRAPQAQHARRHRRHGRTRPLAEPSGARAIAPEGSPVSDLLLMTWTFLWLSLLCVGGGLGVIPEMQRQVVANHQWVTAREFVDGYTLARSALHDVTTIVLAVVAGLVLYHGRVPAMLIVLLGGVAGWLLS